MKGGQRTPKFCIIWTQICKTASLDGIQEFWVPPVLVAQSEMLCWHPENADSKNYWTFENFCHHCFRVSWWLSVKESTEGQEIGVACDWDNLTVRGVLAAGWQGLMRSRGLGTPKVELYKARVVSNLTA